MIKPVIKIDIVSDVVCPWCYIGKRRLEKAMEASSDKYTFELIYHPFELNPNIPPEGFDQKDYLTNKFGGDERYEQITNHTTDVAAQEGLFFNFAQQSTSPNTRNLHAIIQLGLQEGKQLQTVEAFFKAYFTDGVDLSKAENIIRIGSSVGIAKEKIASFLNDDDAKMKIAFAEKEVAKIGVSGVPFYIINNKYGVSGAQLPETFIKAFEEIGTLPTVGEIC